MADDVVSVMFFCLGNICRSPLAEALFRHKVDEAGLTDRFHIESSGTSSYHIGEPPHRGSQRVARERLGLDITDQRAQQLTREHVESFDWLIAMDRSNYRGAERWAGPDTRLHLLRDFEPGGGQADDVPDPWGGGGSQFEHVYEIVDRCTAALLEHIAQTHGLSLPSAPDV